MTKHILAGTIELQPLGNLGAGLVSVIDRKVSKEFRPGWGELVFHLKSGFLPKPQRVKPVCQKPWPDFGPSKLTGMVSQQLP
jgi:hypothetical protein